MLWRIRRIGDGLAVLQRRAEMGDAGMARPLTQEEALAAGDDSLVCCRKCGDSGPEGHGVAAQAHDVCALCGDGMAARSAGLEPPAEDLSAVQQASLDAYDREVNG